MYLRWFLLRGRRTKVIFAPRKLYPSHFIFQDKCSLCLLTMEQVFGSKWVKARCWPSTRAVLCGSCWVLGSLLALKHHQIFALFVAVHPAVCGQDTLVRKSFAFFSRLSKPCLCSAVLSHMPVLVWSCHLLFLMHLVVFSS